jgi:hypothetical protein
MSPAAPQRPASIGRDAMRALWVRHGRDRAELIQRRIGCVEGLQDAKALQDQLRRDAQAG